MEKCITLHASPGMLSRKNTFFICPTCHIEYDRLMKNKESTPYTVSGLMLTSSLLTFSLGDCQ
jgi:hypothetical protein